MRWTAVVLLGVVALWAWPAAAQDIWVGGRLEAAVVLPDGGTAQVGLGPDSVVNVEMDVRENLSILWEHNLARELGSPAAPLLSSPIFAFWRDQYLARLKGLGGREEVNLIVGRFENVVGLRTLGRQDRLYDDFDFGARLEWPYRGYTLSATYTGGHGGLTPQYFLRAEGVVATVSASVDGAWGNGSGFFVVGAERDITDKWHVQAEYLNGDFRPGGVGPSLTHKFFFASVRYDLSGPWSAAIRLRDGKQSANGWTSVKYALHYQIDKDTNASLEWWDFSDLPSQLLLQVGVNF